MDNVIEIKKLDKNFKYQVMKEKGGENIVKCFACGTCTASCPVRAIDAIFNPRKIIRMVLLGMKDEVLKNEFVWLCTACYSCQERCPQDVKITELMVALKNIAVKEGYIHQSYIAQIEALFNNGNLYELDDFVNKKRAKLGLPERRGVIEDTRKLLEEGKFTIFIKKEQKE